MSNPQQAKIDLDNAARLQQMKVSARQFALTMALELVKAPNYSALAYEPNDPEKPTGAMKTLIIGGDVTHVALLAMASDFEAYITGDMEEEAKKAIDAFNAKISGPKIVRP